MASGPDLAPRRRASPPRPSRRNSPRPLSCSPHRRTDAELSAVSRGHPGPPALSRRLVMPDDRLRQIFQQIAELPVDIPPADRVLARGRQRHDRTRLQMSTIAATILLAAGFGGPQVAGSLAANPRLIRHAPPEVGSRQASTGGIAAARGPASPAPT